MTTETTKNIRVHRFRDFVAFHGEGRTEYISAATAREFARLLNAAAKDIEKAEFTESEFRSQETLVSILKKNFRFYCNGGATVDRYTAVSMKEPEAAGTFCALGMSADPFHPQGFGQHVVAKPGRHLGKRIPFDELPEKCQRFVLQNMD